MLQKSKQVVGMPVVSLENGQQVGRVRQVIPDLEQMTVAVLVLDQKGWFKDHKCIPYAAVRSIGNHAITIDSVASVQRASSSGAVELVQHPPKVLGKKVLTSDGLVLGVVEEYLFDPAGGSIKYLELANNFLEGFIHGRIKLASGYILTLGSDALIVEAGTEQELEHSPRNLVQGLRNLKEITNNSLSSLASNGRQLGEKVVPRIPRRRPKDIPPPEHPGTPPEEGDGKPPVPG